MPAKKTATKRATRTKETLQSEFNATRSTIESAQEHDSASKASAKAREASVRASTTSLNAAAVLQEITNTKLSITKALDGLAGELAEQATKLETAREAVALEERELEELHGKEVIASSTKALLEEYAALEAEELAKHDANIASYARVEAHAAEVNAEREATRKKNWQREEADYAYTLSAKRRAEADTYAQQQRELDRNNADRQRQLEANWNTREAAIGAKENEIQALKSQVEAFPAQLSKEVDTRVAIATNSVKKDYLHQIEVLGAKHDASISVLQAEKRTLMEKSQQLEQQIKLLTDQLSAANDRISTLGKSALESASGQFALQQIREMSVQNGQNKPQKS